MREASWRAILSHPPVADNPGETGREPRAEAAAAMEEGGDPDLNRDGAIDEADSLKAEILLTNIVGAGWTSTHNPTNALDLFAASSPTVRGMTMQITA